jgi:hypothetical protein
MSPMSPAAPAVWSYVDVYHATPAERAGMIKDGMGAAIANRLASDLIIGQANAFAALNLSPDKGERVIGIAKLIGQLQVMILASGDGSALDAPAWISRWLSEPLPAFDGIRPIDLMDTMEGQARVGKALAQIQSGAYG